MRHPHLIIVLIIFLTTSVTYVISRNVTSFDSAWIIHTAVSLLQEGNTDLDEYASIIPNEDYRIERINGHLYTIYPIGTILIAAPFVLIGDRTLNYVQNHFPSIGDWIRHYIKSRGSPPLPERIDVITIYQGIELLIASFIVSLTAVLLYLMARFHLDTKRSLILIFIFAFCTPAWSTASRALWQHGPSMLMLAIALYVILSAKKRHWLVQFAGIPLVFSYVIRPSNSLSVLFFSVYILIQYRSYFLRYLFWSMAIAVPFFIFNFQVYHSLLSPYYLLVARGINSNPHFGEALVGNLFSPSRGLFIFSPVLLFSIMAMILKIRNKEFARLDCCLLATLLFHWVSISSSSTWWGGSSFGPRYFSDMIPYFIYFLIPVLTVTPKWKPLWKPVFIVLFCWFTGISFLIQYRGANQLEAYAWNAGPVNVDQKPSRVWDLADMQFLRGIR